MKVSYFRLPKYEGVHKDEDLELLQHPRWSAL